MSTIDDAVASMKKNLAERTGKSFTAWVNIARSLGTDKHSDIVAYLKTEGPMGHGYANAVALEARKSGVIVDEDPVDLLYGGDKASLRPLYDLIATTVRAFGEDMEFAPKKPTSVCGAPGSSHWCNLQQQRVSISALISKALHRLANSKRRAHGTAWSAIACD